MKKIAVVNDISGFGRCSLTAALPIISHLGVQCCPLVTGVFSAQTGFPGFFHADLTDELPLIEKSWREMGVSFDGILTGFISSPDQARFIIDFVEDFGRDALTVVDPVMGDEGKIYPCCTEATIEAIRRLASLADVITPNLSELCILAGEPFLPEGAPAEQALGCAERCCGKLRRSGLAIAVTGITLSGSEIGTAVFENGVFSVIRTPRFGGSFSGTGDIFSSILSALTVKGEPLLPSAERAAAFISDCARETTLRAPGLDRNEGVLFENLLGEL